MDCKTVAEYLPWLLNGSLEPPERAAVEEHLASCESCRRELSRTREAMEIFDRHLPPEALVDHALGRAHPGLDGERIERHLAGCDACHKELALVRESFEARDAPMPVPVPVTARRRSPYLRVVALAASLVALVAAGGWFWSFQQLGFEESRIAQLEDELARLRSATPDGAEQAAAFQARINALERERRELAERAEGLETDIVAGSRQIAELEGRLAAGSGPLLNVEILDLFPGDAAVLRGEDGEREAPAVGGEGTPTLILNSRLEGDAALGVRLVGPDGRELWRRGGLRRDAAGYYSVALPLSGLASGLYTLELLDPAGGGEALESYRLKVE